MENFKDQQTVIWGYQREIGVQYKKSNTENNMVIEETITTQTSSSNSTVRSLQTNITLFLNKHMTYPQIFQESTGVPENIICMIRVNSIQWASLMMLRQGACLNDEIINATCSILNKEMKNHSIIGGHSLGTMHTQASSCKKHLKEAPIKIKRLQDGDKILQEKTSSNTSASSYQLMRETIIGSA